MPQTEKGWSGTAKVLAMTVVLDPADKTFEALKKNPKAVFAAEVPKGAMLVGCTNTPTVMDMIGFSSAGGPPAFVFFTDPDEKERETRVFSLGEHGSVFQGAKEVTVRPLAVQIAAGRVVVIVEMLPSDGEDLFPPFDKTCEMIEGQGAVVVRLREYVPPDLLQTMEALRNKL